jgi:hypothetical protein
LNPSKNWLAWELLGFIGFVLIVLEVFKVFFFGLLALRSRRSLEGEFLTGMPAMAAGVAGHPWTLAELLDNLDAM